VSDVPLRDYIENILLEHDRRADARMNAMDRAVELARLDLSRRLGELNELREELLEDRSQFITRDVYDAREREHSTWREATVTRLTTIETISVTRSITWASAIAIAFSLVNILIIFLKK
jgi:hypothetical protein